MSTDTIQHFADGVWSLRYVLLFVAFLTATGLALEYRHKWHEADGLVDVLVEQLHIADQREADLVRMATHPPTAAADVDPMVVFTDDVPGYIADRLPEWLPRPVPR